MTDKEAIKKLRNALIGLLGSGDAAELRSMQARIIIYATDKDMVACSVDAIDAVVTTEGMDV